MRATRTAQFVISIDVEMSWGAVHHGRPHDPGPYQLEREVVADVLNAMEKHGIAATWAVVGHLFLAECSPLNGQKHPEVIRPDYPWLLDDWYELDPCLGVEEAPTWYGPDLIAAVRSCATPQEIGSHSFGHLIAGEPGCSVEAFRTDLAACQAAADLSGVELRSFVFPRNSVGHVDVLEDSGFIAFRGPTPGRFPELPPWRRRLLSAVDRISPLPSATVSPTWLGGIANIPQTYLFNPDSKTARRAGTTIWSTLVRRRLRHAVRTSSLFHMWFHTHNLATRPDRARAAMDALFAEARTYIDAGRLENLTMGQLADRMGSSHGSSS